MTRQRTRESLGNMLLGPCPYCEGRGRIKSPVTIAYEILRAIKKERAQLVNGKRIMVRLNPEIANFLYDDQNRSLDHLEREINQKIILKASEELPHEKYEITTA
jgi:ribonuclease G